MDPYNGVERHTGFSQTGIDALLADIQPRHYRQRQRERPNNQHKNPHHDLQPPAREADQSGGKCCLGQRHREVPEGQRAEHKRPPVRGAVVDVEAPGWRGRPTKC